MKKILFESIAHKQFEQWEKDNKKVFKKIIELLDTIKTHPFIGI